jgi:hypothetical protein
VLLCLGYCHLLHLRDAAACLKCCEALRQLETEQAGHPAVALLAFQAFMAQGSLEHAEKEATGEQGSSAWPGIVCVVAAAPDWAGSTPIAS